MNCELPSSLRSHIESSVLEETGLPALQKAASDISARYRRTEGKVDFQIKGVVEAQAYLVSRLPATYAANARVVQEVQRVLPDFEPRSALDVGAGPGTASLAAGCAYPSLGELHLLEPNLYLQSVGKGLFSDLMPHNVWQTGQVESFQADGKTYDLVLASYVLNEIAPDKLHKLVEKLWSSCSGVMIIIEPGTPQGAEIIGKIREMALGWGGNTLLAPCPHQDKCPLAGDVGRWCHFSVRTSRSKLHKILKGGDAGFEDEKFSYIVLSRIKNDKRTNNKYRLIGYPSGTKLRELQVCGPNGVETLQVSKSHPLHKLSKKLDWGDGFDL